MQQLAKNVCQEPLDLMGKNVNPALIVTNFIHNT